MRRGTLVAALLLFAFGAAAQRFGRMFRETEGPRPSFPAQGEFHFVRLEYTDLPQYHRWFGFASRNAQGDGWWMVDWPDADGHFSLGIGRLTRVDVGEPRHFRLTDGRLFDHPFVYATQTGWWGLNDREVARQLPGRPITDIAPPDPVMHVVFDIGPQDLTWIPGTRHLRRGPGGRIVVRQPEGAEPAWRAVDDGAGRMVVAANYNTDVGDAWEYADSPLYPEAMTALAYRYGINYVVYAMTH